MLTENKVKDHSNGSGFEHSFNQPCKIIPVVKDAILLPDEINFREQSVKVLVDLKLFWELFHLRYHAFA
jgi:hypothetical protein